VVGSAGVVAARRYLSCLDFASRLGRACTCRAFGGQAVQRLSRFLACVSGLFLGDVNVLIGQD
jgi:hypothetical protein